MEDYNRANAAMVKTRIVIMILNLHQSKPIFSKTAGQRGRAFQEEIAAWAKGKDRNIHWYPRDYT